MQLYSGPISLFTAKVRIALAEKQLEYDRIEVGYSLQHAYLPHHPEVARLNPKGEVPVLLDGDLVVYDSTVVFEYLEERYPNPPLYPTSVVARTRCRQLEAYGDEILFPDLWSLIEEVLYHAQDGSSDLKRIEEARDNFAGHHAFLDEQLGSDLFLAEDFSVADITNFIFLNAAGQLGAPIDSRFERLSDWNTRVGQRATVKAEISEMQEFLIKSQSSAQG